MDTTKLYKKVTRDIKEKIMSGLLKPGEKLPSENELSELYNVSKTTIYKSLTELTNEGYIYAVPRVGSYVSELKEEKYNLNYQEVEMIDNLWNKVEILHYDIVEQNGYYQKQLCISKIFLLDDKVICIDYKYINFNGEIDLNESKLLNLSLSDLLTLTSNLFKLEKLITLEATYCPKDIASKLKISENDVVLKINTKYYDAERNIIGEGKIYYHKDCMNIIATN